MLGETWGQSEDEEGPWATCGVNPLDKHLGGPSLKTTLLDQVVSHPGRVVPVGGPGVSTRVCRVIM